MKLTIPMAAGPLHGVVSVLGDKSLAHRAALFAALAEGESAIGNCPDSGVMKAMRGALQALGVPNVLEGTVLRLKGNGFRPFPNAGALAYCGNSATTIRLLAGALAGTGSCATLDGSEGLRRRPMERVAEPLRRLGADIETTAGTAPIRVRPARLTHLSYDLPMASAQVLSALQIAALGGDGESRFAISGAARDHTVRMLASMGAPIRQNGAGETFVRPLENPLRPIHAVLPGDISSATFLFAAAALVPGSRVTVTGLAVNPTRTGALDVLADMGAQVTYANARDVMGEPMADVTVAVGDRLKGCTIQGDRVVRAIDEIPALAVVAAFAEGETVVREAKELRYKETDRIAAIVEQLRRLGADVTEMPDGFSVRGGTVRGGTACANGDHRLAMSMALCGLRAPVTVDGAEILDESFPSFVPSLRSLMA